MLRWLFAIILLAVPVGVMDTTAFLNPGGYPSLQGFLSGSDNIKIASYTFTSSAIMNDLLREKAAGASITVLVDASPVGGLPDEEVLCELVKNNVSVYLYDGPHRFMHAKYIINGDSVLISTENLGYDGFVNNYGNRGWGVVINDKSIASQLEAVFDEDIEYAQAFVCDLDSYIIYEETVDGYEYAPATYTGQDAELIIAPDAVEDMLDLIDSAERSLYVEQFYIYRYWDKNKDNLFLEAVIDKARQGINVKILMDSYWYNTEADDPVSNLNTFNYVNQIATNENLNLEARLADLSALEVEKLHIKGMIIDGKTALISSINWNENSPRNNREIGVVVSGDAAQYFSDAFMRDWNNEKTDMETKENGDLLVLVLIITAVVAIFIVYLNRN